MKKFLAIITVISTLSFLAVQKVFAQDVFGVNDLNNVNLGTRTLQDTIAGIINIFLGFLGILAVLLILYGGYMWMTSAGNTDKIQKSKMIIISAVIGLVIIVSAYAISRFILESLYNETGAGNSNTNSSTYIPPGSTGCAEPSDINEVRICEISPLVSGVGSGVTIRGWHFGNYVAGSSRVEFGSGNIADFATCGGTTVWQETSPGSRYWRTVVMVPDITPGNYPITLTSQTGDFYTFSSLFNINSSGAQPSIFCLNPSSGPSDTGTFSFDIEGANFGTTDDQVLMNTSPVPGTELVRNIYDSANINHSWVNDLITLTVPTDALSSNINVQVGAAVSNPWWFDVTCGDNGECDSGCCDNNFCSPYSECYSGTPGANGDPFISSISPDTSEAGNFITVYGSNFCEDSGCVQGQVFFENSSGGLEPNAWPSVITGGLCSNLWTDTAVVVAVPPGAVTGQLSLQRSDGVDSSNSVLFNLDNTLVRPGICQLTPSTGAYEDVVDLWGIRFTGSDAVFGGFTSYNTNVISAQQATAEVPNVLGEIGVILDNGTYESNAFPFSALPTGSGLPRITDISPEPAPVGQYLTIRGVNFGNTQGQLFIDGVNGDFTFPPMCSSSFWQDSQIIVKVPTGVSIGTDRVVSLITGEGVASNNYLFDTTNGLPGPGLCYLYPNNGPASAISVALAGDNFENATGPNSDVLFYNTQSAGTGTSWDNENISGVVVPGASQSGPVVVHNNTSPIPSNPMMFNVGSCNGSDSYCQNYGLGDECCSDNTCAPAGGCSTLNSCVYTWQIMTEAEPFGLLYNYNCENDLQSPSPWPDDLDGNNSEDTYGSADIVALFSRDVMDADLLDSGNFEVYECNVGGAFSDASCTTLIAGNRTIINSGSRGEGIVFDPSTNLNLNTWYKVVIGNNQFRSEVGGDVWPTAYDPAPDWHFMTRPTDDVCPVSGVNVSPQGSSADVNIGQTRRFYASPQADNCNMCGENYDWNWSITAEPTTAPPYALYTPAVNMSVNRGFTNLTGINATENETPDHITLQADTTVDGVLYTGSTNPIVRAMDFQVVDYNPNCNGVCSNPRVVVEFSSPVSDTSITANETDFHIIDGGGFDWRTNVVRISPNIIEIEHGGSAFDYNQSYTVTVPSALSNIYGESLGANHVWIFTTGEEECSVEGVEIAPSTYTVNAPGPGTSVPYGALPMANSMSCGWYPVSCPTSICNYVWSEGDPGVALINNINNPTTNAVTTLTTGSDSTSMSIQLTDNSGGVPEVFSDAGTLNVNIITSSDTFTFTNFTPNCGAACLTSAVTITFNNRPSVGSVNSYASQFSIEDSGGNEYIDLTNPLTSISGGYGLMLNYAPPLPANETFTVTVPAGFTDTDSNVFAGHTWSFSTSDANCPITGALISPNTRSVNSIGQTANYDALPMSNNACGITPANCPLGICSYHWYTDDTAIATIDGDDDQMDADVRNELLSGADSTNVNVEITDTSVATPVTVSDDALFNVDLTSLSINDPYIISYQPPFGGTNICPNGAISIHFSEIMNNDSIINNIKLFEQSTDTTCFDDGGGVYWCEVPGSWVFRRIDSNIDGIYETEAIFNPNDYLDFNQNYQVGVNSLNVISTYGRALDVASGPMMIPGINLGSISYDVWPFSTGDHICSISWVEIDPANDVFNCNGNDCPDDQNDLIVGNQHYYDALVYESRGGLLNGTFLNYSWSTGASPLVSLGPNTQQTTLVPNPLNGSLTLSVQVTSTDAGSGSASAFVELFMCENPWPSISTYPWRQTTHNFSTYYCHDTGIAGDPVLPYLPYPPTLINQNPPEFLGEYIFLVNTFAKNDKNKFGSLAFDDEIDIEQKNWKDKLISLFNPNFVFAQTLRHPSSIPETYPPPLMVGYTPFPPSGFSALASDVDITLSWGDIAREDGYWIFRRPEGGPVFSFRANLPANTTSWVDTSVVPGQTYYYEIVSARDCVSPCVQPPDYNYAGVVGPVSATVGNPDTIDIISIRMLGNFKHQSIRDWYDKKFPETAGQGVLKTIDGYEALEVGATTYIAASNISGGQIYTNVYLVAHNVGASPSTVEVYNQLLDNFKFNQNTTLDLQNNICNGTALACSDDFDCPGYCNGDISITDESVCTGAGYTWAGDYCQSLGLKIRRDVKRLGELVSIRDGLFEYGGENMACSNDPSIDNCAVTGICPGSGVCVPYYPLLNAGSFVDGMSTSKWPLSWQGELSSNIDMSLPMDPVNQFNGCVSATADPNTCWDESTLEFSCVQYSQIYLYQISSNAQDFEIGANFETSMPNSTINVSGVNYRFDNNLFNGPAIPSGLNIAGQSTENIIGTLYQCDGSVTFTPGTPTSEFCGNGIVDSGEQCDGNISAMGCSNPPAGITPVDPAGATWWDEQPIGCNPPGTIQGTTLVECQWAIPTPSLTAAECGGYCGDGYVQPFYEVCENCNASGVCNGVQYICAPGNGTATCDVGAGRSCTPVCADLTPAAACGDGIWTEGVEQCDGSSYPDGLANWDCEGDITHGEVLCSNSCEVYCTDGAPYQGSCGNGVVEAGEDCDYVGYVSPSPDVSSITNTYTCSNECEFTDQYCGNNDLDYAFHELCDTDYVTPLREYSGPFAQYQCRMADIYWDFSTGNDYGRCTPTAGGWCGDGVIQNGGGGTVDYGEVCDIGDPYFLPTPIDPNPTYPISGVESSDINNQYECRYDCGATTGGWCGDGSFQEDYEDCDYYNFLSPTPYVSGAYFQTGRIYQYGCSSSPGSLCTGFGGYCGDGVVQDGTQFGGYDPDVDYGETCDEGVNNGQYSPSAPGFCNIDCISEGPYCGDGFVQRDYGETCDGDVACRLYDPSQYVAGSVTCIDSCQNIFTGGCCTLNQLSAKFLPDQHFQLYVNGTTIYLPGTTIEEGTAWQQCAGGSWDTGVDSDGDGEDNNVDNCPLESNVDQADSDGDGYGDVCDCDDGVECYDDYKGACQFIINSSNYPGVFDFTRPQGNLVAFKVVDLGGVGNNGWGVAGTFSCNEMTCESVCYKGDNAGLKCSDDPSICNAGGGTCINPAPGKEGVACDTNSFCRPYEYEGSTEPTGDWEHKPSLCIPEDYGIITDTSGQYFLCTADVPSEIPGNDWRTVNYDPASDIGVSWYPPMESPYPYAWNSETHESFWQHMIPGALPIWASNGVHGTESNYLNLTVPNRELPETIYCRYIVTGI